MRVKLISTQQSSTTKSKNHYAFLNIFGIAASAFALDQITKFLIVQNIPLWASWSLHPVLDPIFRFTFITNTGAAFGMFPQFGSIFMWIAIVAIVGIILFHKQFPIEKRWVRVGLGLQLGGATGNLFDRLTRGYVVDFIDVGVWPIFNLADVSVVCGVCILAYWLW